MFSAIHNLMVLLFMVMIGSPSGKRVISPGICRVIWHLAYAYQQRPAHNGSIVSVVGIVHTCSLRMYGQSCTKR